MLRDERAFVHLIRANHIQEYSADPVCSRACWKGAPGGGPGARLGYGGGAWGPGWCMVGSAEVIRLRLDLVPGYNKARADQLS